MIRTLVLWLATLGVLGGVGWHAARSEAILADGRVVYVPTRPRDPRSLVQGDFHRLRYDLKSGASDAGYLALTVDDRGVVVADRPLTGEPAPDEVRVAYRMVDGEPQIAPTSFLIEEGTGSEYTAARYAELRVGDDGRALLVRLRTEDLTPLGPEPRGW